MSGEGRSNLIESSTHETGDPVQQLTQPLTAIEPPPVNHHEALEVHKLSYERVESDEMMGGEKHYEMIMPETSAEQGGTSGVQGSSTRPFSRESWGFPSPTDFQRPSGKFLIKSDVIYAFFPQKTRFS